MKTATFYPGPSRVYSSVPEYIYEAYMEGIMSINHRSDAFMSIMEDTKKELRLKLLIPEDYQIFFTSSATECWEILAESLTQIRSQHFFNGAFGEKWYEYASKLVNTEKVVFDLEDPLPFKKVDLGADLVCFTQNETSNGTQVGLEEILALRKQTEALIAVDVTSSLGGIFLDFTQADVWYGSSQKCLGLPAGLGIMIVSPRAIKRAFELNKRNHYNSLAFLLDSAEKNQTSYTPNVLGIYLLLRTQSASKGIIEIEKKLTERRLVYENILAKSDQIEFLVKNKSVRSTTVMTLTCQDPSAIKKHALESEIILGSGYGPWKSSTFRIANFPAIKSKEVEKLMKHLAKNYAV